MRTRVVICGSFRRDPARLRRLFEELETTGCRILSPISLDFSEPEAEFVTTGSEHGLSVDELERFHLRAIRDTDLIWLHAPEGHVGTSAAYELGFAAAIHKPVFSFTTPVDPMLASQVRIAASVFESLRLSGFVIS